MNAYLMLVLACLSFIGTHFLMSHSLRAGMIRALGESKFMLVYSVVSLATFYWMITEFGRAPKGEYLWPVGDVLWVIASVITLVAAILFAGSFIRNPSLPGAPEGMAGQAPFGVFRVTRHPMMWGFALWGTSHILVAPRFDNFIFAGSIIFLALVGSKAQEIKKANRAGVAWDSWLRRTSFGLNIAALPKAGIGPWLAGIVIWALATWSHSFMGVAGAGLFRWIGG